MVQPGLDECQLCVRFTVNKCVLFVMHQYKQNQQKHNEAWCRLKCMFVGSLDISEYPKHSQQLCWLLAMLPAAHMSYSLVLDAHQGLQHLLHEA